MQSNRAQTIRFMAAAISATHGISAKTFIATDELWNQYINHASMIYDSLSSNEIERLMRVPHLCDCGKVYTSEDAVIHCVICNGGER